MPRIAYQPADLAVPADLVNAIRQRRGGELLNLDRMLLHSPAFARGWNGFLGEVRTGLALSPKLRVRLIRSCFACQKDSARRLAL